MHTVRLNLNKRSYNIIIGTKIMPVLGRHISRLNLGNNAYIITNSFIKNRYGKALI